MMIINNKFKMDLQRAQWPVTINAVQGDQLSRSVEISLYEGTVPWQIPEGVMVAVRYSKADKTGGYYDTLPDGTTAWQAQENVLTVVLAPQMLTVSGMVNAQVELLKGNALLSTFCFQVLVQPNAAAGVLKSENYVNWLRWMEEELAERLEDALEKGGFVGPAGPAGPQGAAAVLVSSAVHYAVSDTMETIPSDSWSDKIPVVAQGKYLWTRTVQTFNTGDPITAYSVARMGIDGTGSVVSVAGISPDGNGNVALMAADVGALPIAGGTMVGPVNMNGQKLSGLNSPTEETEAASKGYVDSQILERVIKSGGKNLFPIPVLITTIADNACKNLPLKLQAGKTYTLSGVGNVAAGVNMTWVFNGSDNATEVYRFSVNSANLPYTFSPTADTYFVRAWFNDSLTVEGVQIEEGTTATSYEPYYEGLLEITANYKPVLLWQNADPTAEFPAQSISLDLSGYNLVLIFYRWTKESIFHTSTIAKVGSERATLSYFRQLDSSVYKFDGASRSATINVNGIVFYDAAKGNYTESVANNGAAVPTEIYGIK